MGLGYSLVRSENPFHGIRIDNLSWSDDTYSAPAYRVSENSARTLNTLLPALQHAAEAPELHVAITRFGDSFHRTKPYDRVLDYWIALESTLVPRGGKEDLLRVVETAIPLYLYPTHADREEVRAYIQDSYDLRSSILHGNPDMFPWKGDELHRQGSNRGKPPPKARDDLVALTREWVQRTLLKRVSEFQIQE